MTPRDRAAAWSIRGYAARAAQRTMALLRPFHQPRRLRASTSVCGCASPTAADDGPRRALGPRAHARARRAAGRAAAPGRLVRRERSSRRARGRVLHAAGGAAGRTAPGGARRHTRPFAAPWHATRASLHVNGRVRIDRRDACPPTPPATCSRPARCSSAAASSPIATGSTARASPGQRTSSTRISRPSGTPARRSASAATSCSALVADGRSPSDAGLTLGELARDARHRLALGDQPRRRRVG